MLTFLIVCHVSAAILARAMGLQLSVSWSISAYDALLAVFAFCLLCLLALARHPASSSRSSSEEVEQPVHRLCDGPQDHREDTSSSVAEPEEPFVRLTYGQSLSVRDRARALRGRDGGTSAQPQHYQSPQT